MQTDLMIENDMSIVRDQIRDNESQEKQANIATGSSPPAGDIGTEAKRSYNGQFLKKSFGDIGDFYGVVTGYESPYYQVSRNSHDYFM